MTDQPSLPFLRSEETYPIYFCFCDFLRFAGEVQTFSFTVGRDAPLQTPSFIVLVSTERSTAYLAKIRRTRKVGTLDSALDLYDGCPVGLDLDVVARLAAQAKLSLPTMDRQVVTMTKIYVQIRSELLRSNVTLTREYFEFHIFSPDSPIPVQLGDALATAFRIFDRTAPLTGNYTGLQEQDIFDLDIQSFFGGPVVCDPLGRYHFRKGDRLLLLHKVDRKRLEKCIGVDLVYNHVDEKRCVFVQYKCEGHEGKPYYLSSDTNLEIEVERMQRIPGLRDCLNHALPLVEARLCACSAFVKLCKREVPVHQKVPRGAYFPLCVWRKLMESYKGTGIDVTVRPHVTNEIFNEAVHAGLIGTTPGQTEELQQALDPADRDDRVRLVFDERRSPPTEPRETATPTNLSDDRPPAAVAGRRRKAL